jgi:hypothetical protein
VSRSAAQCRTAQHTRHTTAHSEAQHTPQLNTTKHALHLLTLSLLSVPIVQESTRDAIKTAIAANSKGTVGKHQIVIIKISAVQRRNLQGDQGASSSSSSRQLQAAVGGVTVDYQVTVQGSADPTQTEGARTRTRTHTHTHAHARTRTHVQGSACRHSPTGSSQAHLHTAFWRLPRDGPDV